MKQRLIIDLYDHTQNEEILEILERLEGIGLDGVKLERKLHDRARQTHTLDIGQVRLAVKIAADLAPKNDDLDDDDRRRLSAAGYDV